VAKEAIKTSDKIIDLREKDLLNSVFCIPKKKEKNMVVYLFIK
ncbi:unnamed protein product, partial [marine sediment metagenome]